MSMSFLDNPDVESLSNINTLLHLFAHRNNNQHRRSIWWRHFSVFHRQLNALEHDIKQLTATPSTHVERAKLKAGTPQIRTRVEQRLKLWPVSRWQYAFSQLIGDGRFAQLGLFLLAALAQVCTLTQLTIQLEALGEIELQQVLLDFGREHWNNETKVDANGSIEDVGAVVSRQQAVLLTQPTTPPTRKVDTPRKRKKNAIDELFGDL